MISRRVKITVLLGLSMATHSMPTLADVLILQSSAGTGASTAALRSIAAGNILRSGAEINVPAGRRVVLLHADGQTQVVVGPVRYVSPVAAATDTQLLDAYASMFRIRKEPLRLGGVRAEPVASCRGTNSNPWISIAETWDMGCHREALGQLETALAKQS